MTATSIAILMGATLLIVLILWLVCEHGSFLLPSTRAGMRAGGVRNFLNLKGLHLYVYGRWPKQYLNVLINHIYPRLGKQGQKWIRDRYHGKVLTHDLARKIITLNIDIPRVDLEQIIPYPMARDLVLKGPPDVVAFECPCRHLRANPCKPTQVCMAIGQPFADFMLEHHPGKSRRLTQDEALDLLKGEHERGHVHAAWFKDACLDRFYSICNCCKCCCGGIEVMMKYSSPVVASSGFVAVVDAAQCTGCGACTRSCPFNASVSDGVAMVDWEKCLGCGVCEAQCPNGARMLVRDERKGVPLDVRFLVQGSET
ncbi:MAG: 4Fe-4S binding protein [Desulfuromonadales bacterium]|nr:4Fe-4S binding protein [Desulfuromonadales bacterium]